MPMKDYFDPLFPAAGTIEDCITQPWSHMISYYNTCLQEGLSSKGGVPQLRAIRTLQAWGQKNRALQADL